LSVKNENTEKALNAFLKYTVDKAKENLNNKKKNASKTLYNSLKYDYKVSKNSLTASITATDYAEFQDLGVKGARSSRKAPKSPFKMGTGSAPKGKFKGSIDKWVVRKGIAPRGAGGQFQARQQLVVNIMRSIFNTGIVASRFLSDPFEKGFKKLPDEIIEAYGLDVETFLKQIINNGKTS
jgi:hypothetical protein